MPRRTRATVPRREAAPPALGRNEGGERRGMTSTGSGVEPRLVDSLARLAERHPVARKLVVSTTLAVGRELLRRLALVREGWIGFEVTTPRPLALRLARPEMERSDLSFLDAFESRAFLDEAMDHALGSEAGHLYALSDGVGFRERVHGAIEALRLAGLGPRDLERARLSDPSKRRFLRRTLERYERLLNERRRIDTAAVLRMGIAALEGDGARIPGAVDARVVALVPGLGMRGLSGRLIAALAARGAKVLATDPVVGLDIPSKTLWNPAKRATPRSYLHVPAAIPEQTLGGEVELFRAASINDELREALRRAAAKGLRWDQVEIVTPDPAAYGSALHALSSRLGIPVTFAVGLPIGRTRTGRVVRTYLDWIEEGFQADPIRRLLEAGDLRPPRGRRHHAPAALARRFRALRIGWGRLRYRAQILDALAGVDRLMPGRHETEGRFRKRRERTREELEALRSILFPTLRVSPDVADRSGERGGRASPAEIARGLRTFLRRVPKGRGPDRRARDEVERVLERVEATLVRRTDFLAALTVLRRHVDLRVPADTTVSGEEAGVAPWSSAGGCLHLSDVEHGGFSGRQAVFVVGLDADRAPGFEGQDPVLLDADRRVLSGELPTSLELLREGVFRFGALFARLRGTVTLSYSAWHASEGRSLAPSPILLQALRLARRRAALTFSDLDVALGRVVCAVPPRGSAPLDSDDVWMAELGRGRMMRGGVDAVGSAFGRLGTGLAARRALNGTPGPHHGIVTPRPEQLDPRQNTSLVVSASRLEALGTCPLRYLQSSVLGLRTPDDPELDPDRWLDSLRRGGLLHRAYERTLREARTRGLEATSEAFEEVASEALAAEISLMRAAMPVPGEGALRRETAGLRNDVRSFVRMVRQSGAPWVALELKFGLADDDPVVMGVGQMALRLRGAIDRIDEDLEGLRVIDYKTGRVRDFAGTGTFNGGRRLQHALYAYVTEERLRRHVVSGAYVFPTMRGQNRTVAFNRASLADVGGLLQIMLDGVATGSFVPTDRSDDCKFCDFAAICRVRVGRYGKVVSPLAEWSKEHLNAGLWPAFASLKRVRTFEA